MNRHLCLHKLKTWSQNKICSLPECPFWTKFTMHLMWTLHWLKQRMFIRLYLNWNEVTKHFSFLHCEAQNLHFLQWSCQAAFQTGTNPIIFKNIVSLSSTNHIKYWWQHNGSGLCHLLIKFLHLFVFYSFGYIDVAIGMEGVCWDIFTTEGTQGGEIWFLNPPSETSYREVSHLPTCSHLGPARMNRTAGTWLKVAPSVVLGESHPHGLVWV